MKKTRLPGKIKGIFFRLRLDKLIPGKIFHFFANLADLSVWISANKNCGYTDFYCYNFKYSRREDLFTHVIQTQNLDEIDYLEFGVSKGQSFKWWIAHIKNENSRFYGFDTFNGLPEDWGLFKKGDMGSSIPEISDHRSAFFKGLFQQTLIPFLKGYKSDRRKVIHMDADLYSSTLYVLTTISPFLKAGDIIFFDEFNVPLHEFKAFREWSSSYYLKYKVLGGVNNFYQVAVMIEP